MTPNLSTFSSRKAILSSNLELFSPKGEISHRKVAKFRQILIILTHFDPLSPDAPTFFLFALTECPWVRKSQPYTYIHFILKCPPPLMGQGRRLHLKSWGRGRIPLSRANINVGASR